MGKDVLRHHGFPHLSRKLKFIEGYVTRTRPVAATDGSNLARAIFFGPRGGDPLWRRGVGRWQMYCRVCGQISRETDPVLTNSIRNGRRHSAHSQHRWVPRPELIVVLILSARRGLMMPQTPIGVTLGNFHLVMAAAGTCVSGSRRDRKTSRPRSSGRNSSVRDKDPPRNLNRFSTLPLLHPITADQTTIF